MIEAKVIGNQSSVDFWDLEFVPWYDYLLSMSEAEGMGESFSGFWGPLSIESQPQNAEFSSL